MTWLGFLLGTVRPIFYDMTGKPELLGNLLASSPLVSFACFLDQSQKSNNYSLILSKLDHKKEIRGVNVISCNCQKTQFDVCKQEKERVPFCLILKPGVNRDEELKQHMVNELVPGAIQSFIHQMYNLYSFPLSSQQDQKAFLQQNAMFPRIIYSPTKPTISRAFKITTALFRYNVAFAHTLSDYKPKILGNRKGLFFDCSSDKIIQASTIEDLQKYLDQITSSKTEVHDIYVGRKLGVQQEPLQDTILEVERDEYFSRVMKSEQQYLIFCGESPDQTFLEIQAKTRGMFEFRKADPVLMNQINCKQNSILFLPKSSRRKQKNRVIYSNQQSLSILKDISSLIEDAALSLADEQELQTYASQLIKDRKPVIVLLYEQNVPLSFKVVSDHSHLKQEINFFKLRSPSEKLRQKLMVKSMPQLAIYYIPADVQIDQKQSQKERGSMNISLAKVPLKKLKYSQLQNVLAQFAPKFKLISKQVKTIPRIESPKELKTRCAHKKCYLLLLDGSKSEQYIESQVKVVREASSFSPQAAYGWLDATCHSQILQTLKMTSEQLPNLVYLYSEAKKFGRLHQLFKSSSVEYMINRTSNGRYTLNSYQKLTLQARDCQQFHEQAAPSQDSLSAEDRAALEQIIKKDEARREGKGEEKKRRKKKKGEDQL